MSFDSSGSTPGTLIVWVPHWATAVRLSDNQFQPVATFSAPVDMGNGQFQVTTDLKPGVYRIDVELGATADSEWVSIRPGKKNVIPAERWAGVHLASAAPLPASRETIAPAAPASEAETWSRTITWPSPAPGSARLFIFVQTPDRKKYPDFARGLTLLDARGQALTPLAADSVKDTGAAWLAFTTDLQNGFYILRRSGPGPMLYNQPLYLCDGWETQVFIVGGNGPSLRSLTMHMAPFGHGFRRDDDTAAASDAVMSGLRRESAMATVLASSHLKKLLHGEQKNPWLAVLAAYALAASEDENRRPGADRPQKFVDSALKDDVIQFLRVTIGSHPDVRALCLEPDVAAPEPFEYPPLLRIGLQRVQRHAIGFTNTIPVGSLTDRLLGEQIASSPWTVWRENATPARETAESDAPPSAKAGAYRRLVSSILPFGLGPSAPLFRAPISSETEKTQAEELRQVLCDLPIIKAAQAMIGQTAQPTESKIVIDIPEEARKLISEIEPHALSAAASIPLDRAQSELRRLKTTLDTLAAGTGDRTERAILEYALRRGARAGRKRGADEKAVEADAPDPQGASSATIEECVGALRDASEQLSRSTTAIDADPAMAARVKSLAGRLRATAESLLGHADLIAITGVKGEFLYGNGAFTLLMTSAGKVEPAGARGKWCEWLSTLPPGRNRDQKSPVDSEGRTWVVRRTAVEDARTGEITAFVNILEDGRRSAWSDGVFSRVASQVSEVTLHASFVQYGSPKRLSSSLKELERLVDGLEQTVRFNG
jgi:hypothetical protein